MSIRRMVKLFTGAVAVILAGAVAYASITSGSVPDGLEMLLRYVLSALWVG